MNPTDDQQALSVNGAQGERDTMIVVGTITGDIVAAPRAITDLAAKTVIQETGAEVARTGTSEGEETAIEMASEMLARARASGPPRTEDTLGCVFERDGKNRAAGARERSSSSCRLASQ